MKLNNSDLDKKQWDEFHSEETIHRLSSLKESMFETLVSTLDDYSGIIEGRNKIIVRLEEYKSNEYPQQGIKDMIDMSISKIKSLTEISTRFANFDLVLLDINTYAYNCFLAKDDWEWRVFARHIYTVLYEHQNSINILLNDVIRIMKEEAKDGFDMKPFIDARKAFVKVIKDISDYAKVIRLNVDAHFDGSYEERLKLIEDMSFYDVVKLLSEYWMKTLDLLREARLVLIYIQNETTNSMADIASQMREFVDSMEQKRKKCKTQ